MFPLGASQLEDVGKISIEVDRQNKIDGCAAIVMDTKSLVARFIPQNFRAINVYRSSRNYYLAVAPDIGIRGVHGHNRVVFSYGGTEQQRAIFSKLQSQPRQKSGVLIIQPELAAAESFHVAKSIEHGEHVSLFQYPRADIHAG